MNSGFGLLLVFGIGVVAGLRSMTAPAVVAWACRGSSPRGFRPPQPWHRASLPPLLARFSPSVPASFVAECSLRVRPGATLWERADI